DRPHRRERGAPSDPTPEAMAPAKPALERPSTARAEVVARGKIGTMATVVVVALALYFTLWPVPIDPVAWTPPPAPDYTGPFARNERLAAMERLALGPNHGPEAVALDAAGWIYTSTRQGRIVRLRPDGSGAETYAETGGAPLGLRLDAAGNLLVADALRGVLRIDRDRRVTVLAAEADGVPIAYADDLDIARD